MADIADIGFRADTSGLADAKSSLDALSPAAAKAEKAAEKVGKALKDVDKSAKEAAKSATGAGVALDRAAVGANVEATAVNRAAVANDNLAVSAAAAGTASNVGAAASLRAAAANDVAAASAGAAATANGANAAAASAAAGGGLLRMVGVVLAGTAALTVLIAVVAAAVVGVIAFAGAFTALSASVGESTAGLGLNEKQLERLKAKGIDTGLTLTDAFTGLGVAIGQTLREALDGPLKPLADRAKEIWAQVVSFSTDAAREMVQVSVGSVAAIISIWNDIPIVIEDLFYQGVNKVIDGYNVIVQAGWSFWGAVLDVFMGIPGAMKDAFFGGAAAAGAGLSSLWQMAVDTFYKIVNTWRDWPQILGELFIAGVKNAFSAIVWLYEKSRDAIKNLWNGASALMTGNVGHVESPLGEKAAAATKRAGAAYAAGYDQAGSAIDRFMGKWKAASLDARKDRLTKAAGAPGKPKANKKERHEKTDAEKFEDIVTGANNDIAKEKARALAAGVELTAEAAATLEQRTKLLNEAQSKGITLTAGMRSKIDELAAAYGRAKVEATNAVGLRDVLKASDADIAGIKTQIDLIGKYGRELAYATEMAKLLAAAKAKGMTPDAIAAARPQFEAKANEYADASSQLEHDKFMEEQNRAAKERTITLEQERKAIGMSADEATRYRIENELLAQARQKNIDLTPADIVALQGIAKEQADTENKIRKTREALDFAKDAAKGFFADIRQGLSEGKSLWETFGNAAINVLNKLIDKLLNKAIEAAIDALFKAFGGGYADGGIFSQSGVSAYADGGTFTNSVVKKPTMFAYGGSNLGIMGEAGPEAVMPLQRGSDGSLGVQMYGGGSNGGTVIHAPISIQNDNRVTGAVSSADIVELQRKSAEQTKAQIARDVPAIIREYQTNGAIVR